MKKPYSKIKIINDPIYGFISIPNTLILNLIEHPYFQRLRRITQMGLSNLVYPGANHTRFHHALGCIHLMQKAILVLKNKKIKISKDEENAVLIAILLHDIGHGPYSHNLEHTLISEVSHEDISSMFMKELNEKFDNQLSLAIEIFEGKYPRKFLNQLISSQLDIDRLDYLTRDSFYTGVAEGNIGAERLIDMMNVIDDHIVIEKKGIYSVENFIIGRRLMYWQVYFHKTSVCSEKILINIFKRAKYLTEKGEHLPANENLIFFLRRKKGDKFTSEALKKFSELDNSDILSALKNWIHYEDKILSNLSEMIINRKLLKVEINNKPFKKSYIKSIKKSLKRKKWTNEELDYFFIEDDISNQAYDDKKDKIFIQYGNKKMIEITEASDQLNIQSLANQVKKYILCYPK